LELSTNTTVAEIEAASPEMLQVLKASGIFSDGGDTDKTIGELCYEFGLHPQIILNMLVQVEPVVVPDGINPAAIQVMGLVELVEHIEKDHHEFLRERLPRIVKLAAEVSEAREEFVELEKLLIRMAGELEEHLLHEEEALFPMCRDLERDGEIQATACGSKVAGPIECMKREHNDCQGDLAEMRKLALDYELPGGASEAVVELWGLLAELEQNTVEHIYKEDEHLFPRALDTQIALKNA